MGEEKLWEFISGMFLSDTALKRDELEGARGSIDGDEAFSFAV